MDISQDSLGSSAMSESWDDGHDGIFEQEVLIAVICTNIGITRQGTVLLQAGVSSHLHSLQYCMSSDSTPATEPRNALLFKEWLVSHGGRFHPGVLYSSSSSSGSTSSGLSIVVASREDAGIQPDATIVSCPFSVVITPVLCKSALLPILRDASMLERWTERQLIIAYICFHWIASPET